MDAQKTPVNPSAGYPGGLEIPGWELFYKGKVRDLYRKPNDDQHMLMIATDRLSAFDVVMNETVPDRGRVLTHITDQTPDLCHPDFDAHTSQTHEMHRPTFGKHISQTRDSRHPAIGTRTGQTPDSSHPHAPLPIDSPPCSDPENTQNIR